MSGERRGLLAHVVALAAGEGVTRLLGLLVAIYLARTLGSDAFGRWEFAVSLIVYFQILAVAGLDTVGIRAIAQGHGNAMAELIGLRLMLAAGCAAVAVLVSRLLPDGETGSLVLRLSVALLPAAASLRWLFLARESGVTVAIVDAVGQAALLVLVWILVRSLADVGLVPWARVAAEALACGAFAVLYVRRAEIPRPAFDPRRALDVLRGAVPVGLTSLLGQALFNADVLLLGLLGFLGEVGYYAAAYRLPAALVVLAGTYFVATFPSLARDYAAREATTEPPSAAPIAVLLGVTVPLALLVRELAEPIVTIVYGAEFAAAAAPLRLLILTAPVVVIRPFFRNRLLATHQEVAGLYHVATAAALNVGLNLVLIPRFGMLGAAIAAVASEVTLSAAAMIRVRRTIGPLGALRAAVPSLVAGAVMALVLALVATSTPVRVAAALGAYLGVLVVMRNVANAFLRRHRTAR